MVKATKDPDEFATRRGFIFCYIYIMMKDLVRRVIKEEVKNKIESQIDNLGLLQFMKISKMSFAKIFSVAGTDFLTNKIMIQFIKDVVDKNGSFSVHDIGEDPIYYYKFGDGYREISYFGRKFVSVDVYNENNNLGNFHVMYESLDDDKLMEVFDLMIRAYDTFETLGNI